MAVEEREVAALRLLGLTEYESRIYLVLAKMGQIKASELSFFGQVPRTKTYGAIKELERKGLLHIIPGKPEGYAARSPSEVLMPLVTKRSNELKSCESVVQALATAFEASKYVKRDVPKEASQFWEIEGRQNILNKLNQIIGDATRMINFCTSAPGLIRAYKAHAELLDRARRKGSLVRILCGISPQNRAIAEEMSEIVELKGLEQPLVENFVTVDGRELVVIDARPEDLRTDRGSDKAIWTTNTLLVQLHEQLFERLWNSIPVRKELILKEQK